MRSGEIERRPGFKMFSIRWEGSRAQPKLVPTQADSVIAQAIRAVEAKSA